MLPALAGYHENPLPEKLRALLYLLRCFLHYAGLLRGALGVAQCKLLADKPRLLRAFGEQQLHRAVSPCDTPNGVYARSDRKRNACGIHPDRFDTRAPYQLVKPLVLAAVDIFKSPADNEPVLSDKRHYVRHGADCGEVRVLLEYEILVLLKCAEQFQDNSRAAKLLERGVVVGTVRVDARFAYRKLLRWLMVVCNDQLSAPLCDVLCFLNGGNPVVDRDDKLGAGIENVLQRFQIHSVALAAVGYVVISLGAHRVEVAVQHSRGGYAVAVVIAENGDLLSLVKRAANDLHSRFHILYQQRV